MILTKGFVNSCRKVRVLQDFLCQAIDQVDANKYKLCEAMAECRDAQARLFHRFGTEVMLKQLYGRNPAVDMEQMDRRSSRCRLASQLWKKRAEKFKDGLSHDFGSVSDAKRKCWKLTRMYSTNH